MRRSMVSVSPGCAGACVVSHPVMPPPLSLVLHANGLFASFMSRKPVPARSLVPPAQAAVPAVAPCAQPVFAPAGEHCEKNALLTLTGSFFESNEILSGLPE